MYQREITKMRGKRTRDTMKMEKIMKRQRLSNRSQFTKIDLHISYQNMIIRYLTVIIFIIRLQFVLQYFKIQCAFIKLVDMKVSHTI